MKISTFNRIEMSKFDGEQKLITNTILCRFLHTAVKWNTCNRNTEVNLQENGSKIVLSQIWNVYFAHEDINFGHDNNESPR